MKKHNTIHIHLKDASSNAAAIGKAKAELKKIQRGVQVLESLVSAGDRNLTAWADAINEARNLEGLVSQFKAAASNVEY